MTYIIHPLYQEKQNLVLEWKLETINHFWISRLFFKQLTYHSSSTMRIVRELGISMRKFHWLVDNLFCYCIKPSFWLSLHQQWLFMSRLTQESIGKMKKTPKSCLCEQHWIQGYYPPLAAISAGSPIDGKKVWRAVFHDSSWESIYVLWFALLLLLYKWTFIMSFMQTMKESSWTCRNATVCTKQIVPFQTNPFWGKLLLLKRKGIPTLFQCS